MKILLIISSADDPWLLKKIIKYFNIFNIQVLIKRQCQIFPKSWWIIIPDSLTIPKSLKNRITQTQYIINILVHALISSMEIIL